MSIMETIKLFLRLVENKNLGTIFDIVLSKYNSSTDDFSKDTCHDLLRVMLGFQDETRIKTMYEMCVSSLTNKVHKKQASQTFDSKLRTGIVGVLKIEMINELRIEDKICTLWTVFCGKHYK